MSAAAKELVNLGVPLEAYEGLSALYHGGAHNLSIIANSSRAEVEIFGKVMNLEASKSFIQGVEQEFKYLSNKYLFFSKAIKYAPVVDKGFLILDIGTGVVETANAYRQGGDYGKVALENGAGISLGLIIGGVAGMGGNGLGGPVGGIVGGAIGYSTGFAVGKKVVDYAYESIRSKKTW